VQKIVEDCASFVDSGETSLLCCYASYQDVNNYDSDRAVAAAKSAVCLPITKMQLPTFQHVNLYVTFLSSVSTSGRMPGTVARAMNFMLFTMLLVVLSTNMWALQTATDSNVCEKYFMFQSLKQLFEHIYSHT